MRLPGQTKVRQLDLPSVVHQDVGALDVTMEEIALVTIRQALSDCFLIHRHCKLQGGLDQIVYLHDLPHDGGIEALGELDQPRIEKTLQSCLK